MIAATEQPRSSLCTACFTGKYPIPLPDAHLIGKNLLESEPSARELTPVFGDPGRQE